MQRNATDVYVTICMQRTQRNRCVRSDLYATNATHTTQRNRCVPGLFHGYFVCNVRKKRVKKERMYATNARNRCVRYDVLHATQRKPMRKRKRYVSVCNERNATGVRRVATNVCKRTQRMYITISHNEPTHATQRNRCTICVQRTQRNQRNEWLQTPTHGSHSALARFPSRKPGYPPEKPGFRPKRLFCL